MPATAPLVEHGVLLTLSRLGRILLARIVVAGVGVVAGVVVAGVGGGFRHLHLGAVAELHGASEGSGGVCLPNASANLPLLASEEPSDFTTPNARRVARVLF